MKSIKISENFSFWGRSLRAMQSKETDAAQDCAAFAVNGCQWRACSPTGTH